METIMKNRFLGMIAFGAALVASPASAATVINFDNLGNGVQVTNQYAGVTFSSQAGSQILTTAQNLGTSLPNFICSAVTSINCVDDVYLDFATAVSGLSFLAVGDNNVGHNGDVRVFGGSTLLGTVNIIGDANGFTPYLVDLSAFSGITRIEITNITDLVGLGYDDFTFTVGGGSGVPEPATWAMLLLGLGIVGSTMRRRTASRIPVLA
jgi:hypothetical protein